MINKIILVILSITHLVSADTLPKIEKMTFTPDQLSEFGTYDFYILQNIPGTYYAESIGNNTVHVAQRITYFEDMTFICDYRISQAGSIRYQRTKGIWYCLMGWFTEEVTASSDNSDKYRLVRWVNKLDDKKLSVESRTGVTAMLDRDLEAEKSINKDIDALDQKALDQYFSKLGIIGYIAEEVEHPDNKEQTFHRWILKSKLLPIIEE